MDLRQVAFFFLLMSSMQSSGQVQLQMGASSSTERSELPDGQGLPRVLETLDAQQRSLMHAMIEESQLSCSCAPSIRMPWEMPALSLVFGREEDSLIPQVRPVLGYVEPQGDGSEPERPAVSLQPKSTAFEHAISFNSKRVCHLPESEQLLLMLQKWEAVISISYRSFNLGIDIESMEYEQRIATVGEVLRGKSVGTLRQRMSQIGQYVKWATAEAKRPPFPVTAELIKNYVRHLRNSNAPHSKYSGTVEAFRFAKHVVGLECDLEAFDSAWVSGIMRAASQARPPRKQSSVLTVHPSIPEVPAGGRAFCISGQICGWSDAFCNLCQGKVW